jgi:hypothetical protein
MTVDVAPAELAELVIETLRAADRPLSAHATAEALLDIPRQQTGRAECIRNTARQIAPVLAALRDSGRVHASPRCGVQVYEAICSTAEIEARIRLLEETLGGRRVKVTAGGSDPVVELRAPLSRVEAIGR